MDLKGHNLLQQVESDRSKHELLDLKEGIPRIYLVKTGIFQRPNEPHTSIIVAYSLGEASEVYKNTIIDDITGENAQYWPFACFHSEYPKAQLVEKEIKPEKILTAYGFLHIRKGYFNPAQIVEAPIFSYEQINASEGNILQDKILVHVEKNTGAASDRLKREGKTINDVLLSILQAGYVADILPPYYRRQPRR